MYLVLLAVVLVLCVLPVKLGASVVGAKRAELPMCFVALVVASLVCGFAWSQLRFHGSMWVVGMVVSLLLAALVYMLVLGTTYPRGLAVALIQYATATVLVVALGATSFAPMLRHAAAMNHSPWLR